MKTKSHWENMSFLLSITLFKNLNFWIKTFLAIAMQWQATSIYLEVTSKSQGKSNVTAYLSQIAWNWSEIYYFSLSLKWMPLRTNNKKTFVRKGIQLPLVKVTKPNKLILARDSNFLLCNGFCWGFFPFYIFYKHLHKLLGWIEL